MNTLLDWKQLLTDAVSATTKKQVADQLGVSRTAISLIVNGKYPASDTHIAKKVMETFGRIDCPHLAQSISQAQCRENSTREAPPNNSPREMKLWRACQTCQHKHMKHHTDIKEESK